MTSIWPNFHEVITIFLMLVITYSTRLSGYLFLRGKSLSKPMQDVLAIGPACVMASIVGPMFLTTDITMLISLVVTVLLSLYTNFAITVLLSIAFNALINFLI